MLVAAHPNSTTAAEDTTPYTCDRHVVKFHVAQAKGLARAAYAEKKWKQRTPAKPAQHEWFRWHVRCVYDPRTDHRVRAYKRHQKAQFYRYRNTFGPYTPHGKYAIPAYIVHCESGTSGDWRAYNESSGAAGRYQIMPEHERVWPVNSWGDKLQHTHIAYDLSNGGREFSDWACA